MLQLDATTFAMRETLSRVDAAWLGAQRRLENLVQAQRGFDFVAA
jgi:hypothetical protein